MHEQSSCFLIVQVNTVTVTHPQTTANLDCQLVTNGATMTLKELAEYYHLLA